MLKMPYLTDKEKLERIIKELDLTRSEAARLLETDYKTIYRWLDKGIKPHLAQSRAIDELFKEHIDITEIVLKLKASFSDPIERLKSDDALRKRFFLEMTYNSNAIEGSRMTMKETEAAIGGKCVKGKELFEILEAVNHENALNYLLETIEPGFKISEEFILKLHSIVMYNFNNKLPGKYRTGYVNLTNTEVELPSAQMVPIKMRSLIKNINDYKSGVIRKVSSVHYEFESIHPFFDGNGRVGRLVMLAQLLANGYPPALIQVEDRYNYYLALSKCDIGEFKNIVQTVCDAIIKGYGLFTARN